MPNAFALLGLPRAAALDEAALQHAWLEASRAAHPDRPGGDAAQAAELNAAYETLQTPEKRLKHLLDLHQVPWRAIPIDDALMRLFGQIGPALQTATALLKRRQSATSALTRALLAPEELRLREQLEALGTTLESERQTLLAQLPALDTRLATASTSGNATGEAPDPAPLRDLQSLQARLAYLGKWQTQLREALLSLM